MRGDTVLGVPGATLRRVDELSVALEGAIPVGPYSSARPGMLLRVVPGVGRFLASGGTTIEYSTEPDADPDAVEALLQGGVLGALIHQRGELPLHATTLVSPDRTRAVAIAGHSGAGKSTTAFALMRGGWMMVSDDLTRVTIEERDAVAWPGRSRLRLVADACERFGLDPSALPSAPNWPDKYVVDVQRWEHQVRLAALVVLERTEGEFRIDALRGAAAIGALAEQTYRLHYVNALGQARRHLELLAAAASTVSVFRTGGRAPVETVARAVAGVI